MPINALADKPIDFIEVEELLMKFRTQFDGKSDEVSRKLATDSVGESRTKQAFKDESDINNILKKFRVTGVMPDEARKALAHFGDFSNVPSYQDSLNMVLESQSMFMDLPATMRERFGNNPQHLLDFLANPDNRDEAVRLGFVNPPQEPVPGPERGEQPSSAKPKGKPATPKAPPSEEE